MLVLTPTMLVLVLNDVSIGLVGICTDDCTMAEDFFAGVDNETLSTKRSSSSYLLL